MRDFLKSKFKSLQHYKKAAVFGVLGALVILVAMVIINRPSATPPASGSYIDLLKSQDWSHMAGASVTDEGLRIDPVGRAIVNQDGSPGQLNPPVNVRGPHLEISGDFQIKLSAQNIPSSGHANFYLYGAVPGIYDEWRQETPSVVIGMSTREITVKLWDGKDDDPVIKKSWPADVGKNPTLVITYTKKDFIGEVNGLKTMRVKNHNIFQSKNVWFGADSLATTDSWLLNSLQAAALKDTQLNVIPAPDLVERSSTPESLRNLSLQKDRNLSIGTAVSNYSLFSDSHYRKLVASQFNLIVPENELKAQFVHPRPNLYSFTEADSLVDFAAANNMQVHGHNLVFSEANPVWMQNTPSNKRTSVMVEHISTVVSHYGDKINSWDVVDEPLADDEVNGKVNLRSNIWLNAMGKNYIDIAFSAARRANPSAKLYLNEYGLEQDGAKWQAFLALIKRLQSRQVPIDGVGFQAHVHEKSDKVDKKVLIEHMQTLAKMGLVSRISEADVYGENQQFQADQYADLLTACLSVTSCTSFTTWGVSDRYGSTTTTHNYPLELGDDLIWGSNLQVKPAYKKLQNVLKGVSP